MPDEYFFGALQATIVHPQAGNFREEIMESGISALVKLRGSWGLCSTTRAMLKAMNGTNNATYLWSSPQN